MSITNFQVLPHSGETMFEIFSPTLKTDALTLVLPANWTEGAVYRGRKGKLNGCTRDAQENGSMILLREGLCISPFGKI